MYNISNSIPTSNSTVLTYSHICICMNRFDIYSIYHKKGKSCCVIQYKFKMLVSAPLEYINTNYTLLASSARSATVTESRCERNMKDDLEEDATAGKKKLYKNLIYNEFACTYAS